tara:strand:- start:464 stop:670 length:207 start_codon:yes stop_codon:yes gene_type:complete
MKVKLIKTVESTKTVTYEMELDINQVGEYLNNEEKFIDSVRQSPNFKPVDSKENTTDWIRIYTDKTPY